RRGLLVRAQVEHALHVRPVAEDGTVAEAVAGRAGGDLHASGVVEDLAAGDADRGARSDGLNARGVLHEYRARGVDRRRPFGHRALVGDLRNHRVADGAYAVQHVEAEAGPGDPHMIEAGARGDGAASGQRHADGDAADVGEGGVFNRQLARRVARRPRVHHVDAVVAEPVDGAVLHAQAAPGQKADAVEAD